MHADHFRELADRIELEDRFDLGYYAFRSDRKATTGDLTEDCGTVGCVAGWACALAGSARYDYEEHEIWGDAARWLGIDRDAARRLFYAEWISIWARLASDLDLEVSDYDGLADWSSVSSTQAAKVLRMIADGEVEL